MGPEPGSPTIRFGDGLELDARAWELRRAGQPQKLERIPMEILMFLAQQRGQLVSREQIVEKVWGKGVYLDTDNSINGAMRKIRQALGDDSGEPRYIQTVTGLGYRFVAQLAPDTTAAPPQPAATAPANAPSSVPANVPASVTPPGTGQFVERRRAPPAQPPTHNLASSWWWVSAALIVVLCVALLWMLRERPRVTAAPPAHGSMLAVLPLTNLTGDASQEYFSDGLTEELIAQLGNTDPQRLSVIARTSVMRYKDTHEPVNEIARALGAQYVLEGSVRRDSENVRITAQLVRASDQAHVWARQYDRKLTSVLALQGEIAAEIADEIRATLGQGPAGGSAARPAQAPRQYAAYDLYLRGRYYWNKRTAAGFAQALDYFQQSITQDPGYAPAHAGVADTYAMMSNYGLAPHTEAMVKARAAAVRAIELDANLAEAHNALAVIAEDYDYDWRTAEKEFQRALELNPNYATAHQWYAQCLALQGRFAEALTHSERARALDPLSTIVAADHAVILYFSRQYERAIDASHAALAMDQSFGRVPLAPALVLTGRSAEALTFLNGAGNGAWIWAIRAFVYGRTGELAKAADAIAKMDDAVVREHVDPYPIRTTAYAGVQDKQQTLANLEAGYSERASFLTTIKVEPLYDFLRADPRFQDLMRRVGLR